MQIDHPFEPFPKMARLSREIVITEKIDGTNAQVCITEGGQVLAGSRTRWITPADDNFGFARWVEENYRILREVLGSGRHFGEWWGSGIQRGYGLQKGEKRFSLFNTSRWGGEGVVLPACLNVVPEIYRGEFSEPEIAAAIQHLKDNGSMASPGFMNPEGVIIYHVAAGIGFKKTIEGDEMSKGEMEARKQNGN